MSLYLYSASFTGCACAFKPVQLTLTDVGSYDDALALVGRLFSNGRDTGLKTGLPFHLNAPFVLNPGTAGNSTVQNVSQR